MKRDQVYLLDILEAAKLALSYVHGVSKEEFLQNTQLQDSVIRRIEIMGEAARRLSSTTRENLPGIPWPEMIGMRNLMIHDYDGLDLEVVWYTVLQDLPNIVTCLEPLV